MKLNKRQKKSLKYIYRRCPQPYDDSNTIDCCWIDYDHRPIIVRNKANRMSMSQVIRLANLKQIGNLFYNENDNIKKTTYVDLEAMADIGMIVRMPDLYSEEQKLDYDGNVVDKDKVPRIMVYQITEKGIKFITYRRKCICMLAKWALNTFITVAGISLLLKLMKIIQ